MGIILPSIDVWARTVDRASIGPDTSILTLGKQAVYFTYDNLVSLLRRRNYPYVELKAEDRTTVPAESLSNIHHGQRFIDDGTLFRVLGFHIANISRLDINAFEGADVIFDLNTPWSGRQFDFVFDQGTGEHIFSQQTYFQNVAKMLRVGGFFHAHLPSNDIGHGYYCYGKDALRDFFSANGFHEKYLRYVYVGNYMGAFWDYVVEMPVDRDMVIQSPIYGVGLSAVFQKIAEVSFRTPNQTTYVEMWEKHNEGKPTWTPPRNTLMRTFKTHVARYHPILGAALMAAINTRRILRNGHRIEMPK